MFGSIHSVLSYLLLIVCNCWLLLGLVTSSILSDNTSDNSLEANANNAKNNSDSDSSSSNCSSNKNKKQNNNDPKNVFSMDQLVHKMGDGGHTFVKKNFHKPTYCHHCSDLLWFGLIGQGYICEGKWTLS